MLGDEYVVLGDVSSVDGDATGNHGAGDIWIAKLTHDYNTIQGKVYADLNSSGLQEPNEPSLPNHMVSESFSQRMTFTEPTTGNYGLTVVSPGIFPTSADPILHYTAVPMVHNIEFTGLWEEQTGVDFAFQPIGVINDLQIELTSVTAFRSGFPAQYQLTWQNIGTTSLMPTVVVEHDTILEFEQSGMAPSSISVAIALPGRYLRSVHLSREVWKFISRYMSKRSWVLMSSPQLR